MDKQTTTKAPVILTNRAKTELLWRQLILLLIAFSIVCPISSSAESEVYEVSNLWRAYENKRAEKTRTQLLSYQNNLTSKKKEKDENNTDDLTWNKSIDKEVERIQQALKLAKLRQNFDLTPANEPDSKVNKVIQDAWHRFKQEKHQTLEELKKKYSEQLTALQKGYFQENLIEGAIAVREEFQVLERKTQDALNAQFDLDDFEHLDKVHVTIGTKTGSTLGFICKLNGKFFVMTNITGLIEVQNLQLERNDGLPINPGAMFAAKGYDLMLITIPEQEFYLTVMDKIHSTVKIGDLIRTHEKGYRNQTMDTVKGKILGLGPTLLEVEKNLIQDNSGSPIIHEETGLAIGIASFEKPIRSRRQFDHDAFDTDTRWFAYRIDNIGADQWQLVHWNRFRRQAKQLEKVEALSIAFSELLYSRGKNYKLNKDIRNALETLKEKYATTQTPDAQIHAIQQYHTRLRHIASEDIDNLKPSQLYDCFRRQLQEHRTFREHIQKELRELEDTLRFDRRTN